MLASSVAGWALGGSYVAEERARGLVSPSNAENNVGFEWSGRGYSSSAVCSVPRHFTRRRSGWALSEVLSLCEGFSGSTHAYTKWQTFPRGVSFVEDPGVVDNADSHPRLDPVRWEEVRQTTFSVLSQYLVTKGLSALDAEQLVQESSAFTEHLLTVLKSCFPARYSCGEIVSEDEVRNVLLPYLENVSDAHGEGVDILVKVPSFSGRIVPGSIDSTNFVVQPKYTKELLSDYPLLLEHLVDGKLPSSLSYFLSIGLTPARIDMIVRKFPPIATYDFERRIQKVVNFLLSLDVPMSQIPRIVFKRPHLFGYCVEENLRVTVRYLENLGLEKSRWPRILVAFPHILTYSQSKYTQIFNFLLQVGFSKAGAGKVISRFPHIFGYSIEGKLRPLVKYFHSIGVIDVSLLVMRSPQTLGLSLECNIKLTVEFFLNLGFNMPEVAHILVRFPQILGLNVQNNLQPKWVLFEEMKRPMSELVDFPQYFGYSLGNRIEPRHRAMTELGIVVSLNRMLSPSEKLFYKLLLVKTSRIDEADARTL